MKLQEEHKVFVVKHFARFMKLTDIVEAFMEEFEEDLPQFVGDDRFSVQELFEGLLEVDEGGEKQEFIEKFMETHREEFEKEYGDEADQKLNERVLEEYEKDRWAEARSHHNEHQREAKKVVKGISRSSNKIYSTDSVGLTSSIRSFPISTRTLFRKPEMSTVTITASMTSPPLKNSREN